MKETTTNNVIPDPFPALGLLDREKKKTTTPQQDSVGRVVALFLYNKSL
jgi:hypothetical protein